MSEEIVDVEEELVEVDDTTDTEEETEESNDPYANLSQEEAIERLRKAEAAIVKHKKAPVAEKPTPQATPTNVEEVVLQANGMPDELLEQLKKVAAINGTSLIKAQNDPIFVAVKEKFEKDQKQTAASLGASKGVGGTKVQKTFSTPGLTKEEHRKLAMEALK